MELAWEHHAVLNHTPTANVFGYYTHNLNLKAAVESRATVSADADDVVHITTIEAFKPVPGRRNWLFTMWEGWDLPKIFVYKLSLADYLIAPSTWCAVNMLRYLPNKQIFVVPHGVNSAFFFKQRELPKSDEKFRYLYVGAMNNRKGVEELAFAWRSGGFWGNENVEMYIKTTMFGHDGVHQFGNMILDCRSLSVEQLTTVYHDAHCFVFPTRGEGFGLTLAEAMRTGLPCISSNCSGITDFFDTEVGYPLRTFLADAVFSFPDDDGNSGINVKSRLNMVEMGDLVHTMYHVANNYTDALEYGRAAAKRMYKDFTWDRSADLLIKAIATVQEQEAN